MKLFQEAKFACRSAWLRKGKVDETRQAHCAIATFDKGIIAEMQIVMTYNGRSQLPGAAKILILAAELAKHCSQIGIALFAQAVNLAVHRSSKPELVINCTNTVRPFNVTPERAEVQHSS